MTEGKLSLDLVMKELQVIKETQKRYSDQFLGESSNSTASCSCVTGQIQQLQDLENAISRIDGIIADIAKQTRENERNIDDLEKYGRRNCLILYGCSDQFMRFLCK